MARVGVSDAPLSVLVVDDEPLARARLRAHLERRGAPFAVAGECGDGAGAVDAIERLAPDLVLLDVQMPGLDGFDVIEAVGVDAMPPVVFVTAYDEYAVRAFDVNALDYLEKPWDPDRLDRALDRCAVAVARSREGSAERLALLLTARPHARGRLIARAGRAVVTVPFDEIEWVEAAGNYARLHTAGGERLVRETLKGLEARLPASDFVRIHRSTLVRLERVVRVEPDGTGGARVELASGARLRAGRRQRAALARLRGER